MESSRKVSVIEAIMVFAALSIENYTFSIVYSDGYSTVHG